MEKQSTAGFWLSPQQKYVWSWPQQQNAVCAVEIDGALQEADLRGALRTVIARHEILRTVFVRQSGMKVPFQVVQENLEPAWQSIDLRSGTAEKQIAEIVRTAQTASANLEEGPVVHATLVRLSDSRWTLILSLPALSSDFRSMQNLVQEIGAVYADEVGKLNSEPLRYVQFAQWQSELLESGDEAAQKAKEAWTKFAVADSLAFPKEIRNPTQESGTDGCVTLRLDAALLKQTESIAAKHDTPVGNVLLSGWQSLVWRLTGNASFALGVFFDGREYEELQDAMGFIGKTLPVPARFDGEFRFSEVLQSASDAVKQATEWQEHYAPGEIELPVGFEYRELSPAQTFKNVTFRIERATTPLERFKLKLLAVRGEAGLTLELHYDSARFEQAAIERVAGYFQSLLAAAVAAPETVVSRLPLLPESERRQLLLDWNQTAAAYPQDRCLHQLFEAQAARTPDRMALVSGEQQLTYRQWNEQANQLAHYLRTLGVAPDSLVGLCVDRSAAMMVALLAILKAGGAYVALNPDNPKPRLAQQLSGAVALITENKLLAQMPEFSRQDAVPRPR